MPTLREALTTQRRLTNAKPAAYGDSLYFPMVGLRKLREERHYYSPGSGSRRNGSPSPVHPRRDPDVAHPIRTPVAELAGTTCLGCMLKMTFNLGT